MNATVSPGDRQPCVLVRVDHRERRSRLFIALTAAEDIDVHLEPLSVGDYVIDDRVLVERKTFSDFQASIVDARLFQQARRLRSAKLPAVIIIEGRPKYMRLGRKQIQGALLSLSLVFKLPVLRSLRAEETLWLLRMLSRQSEIRMARGFSARRFTPRDLHARRIHLLSSLPKVGAKRAANLLEHFGSLRAVLEADVEELASVASVGPKVAKQIRSFLDDIVD